MVLYFIQLVDSIYCCKIIFVYMQNLYKNFLHEKFLNYSNRAVIHVNHTKIFLHENFYHEIFLHKNKANFFKNYSILIR